LQAALEPCISEATMAMLVRGGIQIVLPNIGLSFLRDSQDDTEPSHWRDFCDFVVPLAERHTETTAVSRWMTGISMGGFAALSACFRRPEFFAGCGVHFPGIVDFDPFDDAALHAYAERTGISATHRDTLAACFRGAFADAADVARHDPAAGARD
jgi:S-formylglutathione hydrolase FrmB